jgi:hypothetical protein
MVAFGGEEYLGLVSEPAKGLGMDDPVPVLLEKSPDGIVRLLHLAAEGLHNKLGAFRKCLSLYLFGSLPVAFAHEDSVQPVATSWGP